MSSRQRALLCIYRFLLVVGILLIGVYSLIRVGIWVISRAEIHQMDSQRSLASFSMNSSQIGLPRKENIDFSLWSKQRIQKFKESLRLQPGQTLAVLELERLRIRVPVFDDTDDLSLNLGAGWVKGTARPGEMQNTVIAGHRDGFFRALKDIQAGDPIEIQMKDKTFIYRVSSTEIINPEEVRVLMPRGEPALTLVTCYPFYYAGNAPKRFIVHAALTRTMSNVSVKPGK